MLYPLLYYTNVLMSTNRQQNNQRSQQRELKQLQSLHGVGRKTIQRLRDSDSYHNVSDVEEADPVDLKNVIELNYADTLWIQTRLENNGDNR